LRRIADEAYFSANRDSLGMGATMFGTLLRVIIGFIVASIVAGVTKVLFVYTPADLASLPADVAASRIGTAFDLALGAAVQSGLFAAPFAFVAAALGEWRRLSDWTYYAIIGMLIALIGFITQFSSESVGQPTIINNYALTAFLTAGFLGGLAFWMVSGRSAGAPAEPDRESVSA
jgi:hypothetical protein